MYELINVEKTYQNQQVLKKVTTQIQSGEILGIVGKSGSGKSTLLRLLNLVELPSSGEILVAGFPVRELSKKQRRIAQREIGVVFQQFNLLQNRTVAQNVALPLKIMNEKNEQRVDELLNYVGLADKKKAYPAQLSGGEKQRVAIARALVRQPKLLLLDEATSALDERTTRDLLALLQKIHQEFALTMVFVSHELSTIKALCQRVLVMEEGRFIGEFPNQPVEMNTEASETYLEMVQRRLQE